MSDPLKESSLKNKNVSYTDLSHLINFISLDDEQEVFAKINELSLSYADLLKLCEKYKCKNLLHFAIEKGNLKIIESLMSHWSEDATNKEHQSLLFFAPNESVLGYLLSRGVSATDKEMYDMPYLYRKKRSPKTARAMLRELIKFNPEYACLPYVVTVNDFNKSKSLLNNNDTITIINSLSKTLKYNFSEIIKESSNNSLFEIMDLLNNEFRSDFLNSLNIIKNITNKLVYKTELNNIEKKVLTELSILLFSMSGYLYTCEANSALSLHATKCLLKTKAGEQSLEQILMDIHDIDSKILNLGCCLNFACKSYKAELNCLFDKWYKKDPLGIKNSFIKILSSIEGIDEPAEDILYFLKEQKQYFNMDPWYFIFSNISFGVSETYDFKNKKILNISEKEEGELLHDVYNYVIISANDLLRNKQFPEFETLQKWLPKISKSPEDKSMKRVLGDDDIIWLTNQYEHLLLSKSINNHTAVHKQRI